MLRLNRRQAAPNELEPPSGKADNAVHGLDAGDRALAQPPARGAQPHPPRPDPAERRREHGLRGRSGGPGDAADGTRAPRDATRHIQTRLGILSYSELAPHLARNVLALEKRIEDGEFEPAALDDALLLRFHTLICSDLVPQLAGWRRTNVTVGEHEPPDFFKVRVLAREYARDLEARLAAGAEARAGIAGARVGAAAARAGSGVGDGGYRGDYAGGGGGEGSAVRGAFACVGGGIGMKYDDFFRWASGRGSRLRAGRSMTEGDVHRTKACSHNAE